MLARPARGGKAAQALAVNGVPETDFEHPLPRPFDYILDVLRIGMEIEQEPAIVEPNAMSVGIEKDEVTPAVRGRVSSDPGEKVPPMPQPGIVVVHQVNLPEMKRLVARVEVAP